MLRCVWACRRRGVLVRCSYCGVCARCRCHGVCVSGVGAVV